MDAPAQFPRDEAALAEWSVYADALLVRGDRRGEAIAHELALSATPSDDELAAFRARANKTIQIRTKGRAITWSLGHVRILELLAEPRAGVSAGVLGGMAEQLGRPEYARCEELRFTFFDAAHLQQWRLLFRRLPPTCTRVVVDFRRAADARTFAELVALMPASIRELVVGWTDAGMSRALLRTAIDDRFAHVELSHRAKVDVDYVAVVERLAETRRVHVRTNYAPADEPPDPRIELGEPGDGIVELATYRCAFRRWRPDELQNGQEVVPIRMLLARTLPEGFMFSPPLLAPHHGSRFVRDPSGWSFRRDPFGARTPLAPGPHELDGKPFVFSIRD